MKLIERVSGMMLALNGCFLLQPCLALDRNKAVLSEELIPPSGTLNNHAATLTEAKDGTLVAAWFGGSDEGADDVSIWLSRYAGSKWSAAEMIDDGRREDGKDYACWNPVLVTGGDGTLYLYYKISSQPAGITLKGYENWWGCVKTSKDMGKTWSARVWLPEGNASVLKNFGQRYIGPVKNKPLILPDGTLLSGSSTETDKWRTHIEISKLGGWTSDIILVGPISGAEAIQPTFLVISPDYKNLQVICRQRTGLEHPYAAYSSDMGRTWSKLDTLKSLSTTAGLDALTTRASWHFLVHNPAVTRYPLMLARSRDGKVWEDVLTALDQDGTNRMDYPAIYQTKDGRIHVVHSWARSHIKHLVLDQNYLSDQPTGFPISVYRGRRKNVTADAAWIDSRGRLLQHWKFSTGNATASDPPSSHIKTFYP
jgi:predicted neuraminidase